MQGSAEEKPACADFSVLTAVNWRLEGRESFQATLNMPVSLFVLVFCFRQGFAHRDTWNKSRVFWGMFHPACRATVKAALEFVLCVRREKESANL